MIFEDCRYDARKSRELVNMKILVSLDKFCLSYSDGFYSVSQSGTTPANKYRHLILQFFFNKNDRCM